MSFATATRRADSSDLVNRRLAGGLLLSILLHALLLSLRFGVPGLGLPSPVTPQPISITIAPPAPPVPPAVEAPAAEEARPPPVPAPAQTGMQVVAPATPLPKPVKPKRSKPRRVSRPLPPRELVDTPTPVIAQDLHPNDFIAPMPQPQEAEQKTVDPKQAQDGSDDGAAKQAALLAETLRKEEEEREAARQEQERLFAVKQAEQQQAARAEELALRQRAEQLSLARQAEQAAARQKADELARQQAEELRQQADRLVRQQAEQSKRQQGELAARQQAEQLARQQAEQLARQQAEQLARQQAEQLSRQQAEQLSRQQAEQAARQAAEQAARQQAERAAAAERDRAAAAAAAALAGAGNNGAGTGGSGSAAPKNPLGSDLGNRVRELTRGIDLLSGAPPVRARDDSERGARRVVSGGAEQDVSLRMYVDSFRQKVERNGAGAAAQRGSDPMRSEPLVSVAIRSDGSVEEVTIVRSSGHADTDNAVRRIIRLNARYSAFPPTIAARYDVIEIRRIWSFAESLKLLEELR
jgi:TonB family protein